MKHFFLRSMSWIKLVRRLPHLRHIMQLLWRLVRDRRVPIYLKGMLGLAIAYVLSPLDLIPEGVALAFGLVDDLAIMMAGINWFLRLAPKDVVDDQLKTLPPDFQQSFQEWQNQESQSQESRRDQQSSSRADGAG
ncbi:MAG: hypothetical protein ETSY1_35965 [Candidatus Entotheonella factor]|uniref:DUF1232 domain-containing protein n=1 Tax=Entotheonella factor TaxID=1429438 RepID=W4L8E9_ENTF1|nr:YkvA family protein [Candidatus Entotheonella palauensis]ETW94184.1 MAG: hypothetical protein ETSY1_35965 [Candidatus Entotheonella factor]